MKPPICFNLLISLYPEKDPSRQNEFKFCLKQNLQNEYIKDIYIFYEGDHRFYGEIFSHDKITAIPITARPTFAELFNFANINLSNQHVIIANADIFFDGSLSCLNGFDFANTVLALTRYSHGNCLTYLNVPWNRNPWSQDSWIFYAPIKTINANFKIGWLACDNMLAWELKRAGFRVFNPSLTIKTWHVHAVGKRDTEGVPIGAGSYQSQIKTQKKWDEMRLQFIELDKCNRGIFKRIRHWLWLKSVNSWVNAAEG